MDNLAKVYPIHDNLWAIDEAGKTLMYLYAGGEARPSGGYRLWPDRPQGAGRLSLPR